MVCLRNICINTLHRGDNDNDDDDDDDDDNNNNNTVGTSSLSWKIVSQQSSCNIMYARHMFFFSGM